MGFQDGRAGSQGQIVFPFRGEVYTETSALATAFTANWADAAGQLRNPAGQPAQLLRQFIEARSRERFDPRREDALSELASQDPVNVRLLAVLRYMAPGAEPVYGGGVLGPGELWNLTRHALRGRGRDDEVAHDWVMEIVEHGVLRRFTGAPGGEGLAEIEQRRLDAERRWEHVRHRLTGERPALAGALEDERMLPVQLLNIAVDEARAARRLDRELGAALSGLPVRLPWFERQLRAAGTDPLLLLAALMSLPEARADAERAAEGVRQTWEAQEGREEAVGNAQGGVMPPRTRRGQARPALGSPQQGRVGAMFWAVAGMSVVSLLWWAFLLVLLVSDEQRGSVSLVVGFVCLAEWAAECALAFSMGRRYHPDCALLPRVARLVLAPVEAFRTRGFARAGMLLLFVVLVLSLVTGWLPYLIPGAVGLLHLLWTYLRWVDQDRRRVAYP
ncbi:hypothetical protein [Actinomadura fibrosa]|uniref:Uncharacterized protein n=1 Tax=Actinomadura fibrosa TaxID=111802 RepID=A0ABW2XGY2_9ACTN|nr:hypothetical protein [Actinomadura fibrosa]